MREKEKRFGIRDFVTEHFNKLFYGAAIVGFAGIILIAGFVWGESSTNEELTYPTTYNLTLLATAEYPITVHGNPLTGEVECHQFFGIVHVISGYDANMGNVRMVSSRTMDANGIPIGYMVPVTMDAKMISCSGQGKWD